MTRILTAAALVFAFSPVSISLGQTTEGAQQSSFAKGAPV